MGRSRRQGGGGLGAEDDLNIALLGLRTSPHSEAATNYRLFFPQDGVLSPFHVVSLVSCHSHTGIGTGLHSIVTVVNSLQEKKSAESDTNSSLPEEKLFENEHVFVERYCWNEETKLVVGRAI